MLLARPGRGNDHQGHRDEEHEAFHEDAICCR
jgi:hypothetical protein